MDYESTCENTSAWNDNLGDNVTISPVPIVTFLDWFARQPEILFQVNVGIARLRRHPGACARYTRIRVASSTGAGAPRVMTCVVPSGTAAALRASSGTFPNASSCGRTFLCALPQPVTLSERSESKGLHLLRREMFRLRAARSAQHDGLWHNVTMGT